MIGPNDENSILWMPFNEGRDFVKNITITGPELVGDRFTFNGTAQNINIGDIDSLVLSVSFWYKANTTGNQSFIDKMDTGTGWALISESGSLYFSFRTSSGNREVNYVWAPVIGQTYHICGTYDGYNTALYIDGVRVGHTSQSIAFITGNNLDILIGARNVYTTNNLNGEIYDLKIWDKGLTQTEVENIYTGQGYSLIDLIFDFPLVFNYSTSGNPGIITGANYIGIKDGSYALDFNGSTDYVDVGDSDSFTMNKHTILLWIKSKGTRTGTETIISKYFSSSEREFLIGIEIDGTISYQIYDDSGDIWIRQKSSNIIDIYSYTLLTFTWDGTTNYNGMKIYVNGNIIPMTGTNWGTFSSINNSASSLIIGGNSNIGNYFEGEIRFPMIFNKVLSESEIKQIYKDTFIE